MVTPGPRLIALRRSAVDVGSVAAALVTVLVVSALVSGVVASLAPLQQQSLRSALQQLPADEVVVEVVASYDVEGAAGVDLEVRAALQPLVDASSGLVVSRANTVEHRQAQTDLGWTFTSVTGPGDTVVAVDGRLPAATSGPLVEVATAAGAAAPGAAAPGAGAAGAGAPGAGAAGPTGLAVGDRLTLVSPLDDTRVRAEVVGTWRPGPEALLATGRPSGSSLLVAEEAFAEVAGRASSVRWRMAPSVDRLRPADVDELAAAAGDLEHRVEVLEESLDTALGLGNPLVDVLEARSRELLAQRMLLLMPAVMLLLLGAAAVVLVARVLSESRGVGEALLRSRGADRGQVVAPTVLEATAVCALAALAGPPLAAAMVRIGGARPSLATDAWVAGAVAAAVCWLALVLPAVAQALGGDSGEQLTVERRRRRRLTALIAGVLLVVALGGVSVLAVGRFSTVVAAAGDGADPLVVSSPALLLVTSVTLLALLLLPALFRLSEKAGRTRGVVLALGTRSAARAPGRAVPLALAVALAAGGITFATTQHASQLQARDARAAYEVGTDVRVVAAPASRRLGPAAEREELAGIPGVLDVAGVHRELDFVDDVAVEVLVADLDGPAGRTTVAAASDPERVLARLRAADTDAVPVVVTNDLAEDTALRVGDVVELPVGDETVSLEVVDTVPALPTLSEGRGGILVDSAALSDVPDEWWLAVEDAQVADVAEALAARPELATRVMTRDAARRRMADDPGTGGAALVDTMAVTALGALVIGGVLLCSVVVIRRRERGEQATALRALGAPEKEVTWTLVTEYTVTTGAGLVSGALAGVLTAAVLLQATALGPGGPPMLPTPELVVPWGWTLLLLAALLVMPMAALQGLTWWAGRTRGRAR